MEAEMTRNGGGEWEPQPASTEGFGMAVETSHATAYRETCAATRAGVGVSPWDSSFRVFAGRIFEL